MLSVSTVAEMIKCILSQLDRLTKLEFKFQVGEPARVLEVQPFEVEEYILPHQSYCITEIL